MGSYEEMCQALLSKDVKIAKTAFRHAKVLGYVEHPFVEITAGTDVNPENAHCVELADLEKIL
jgi:hypothetical protein